MTVPVGKRRTAYSAYVQKMVELHEITNVRLASTPARYRKLINEPIWKCQSLAYMEVLYSSEIRPSCQDNIAARNEHLMAALNAIWDMQGPLLSFWNVRKFDDRRMNFWADKINEEILLITKLLNKDEEKVQKQLVQTISWQKVHEMNFLDTMSKLHRYCYQKVSHAPQIYYDYVLHEIIQCADKAWAEVLKGDAIFPENAAGAKQRAAHFRNAIDSLNVMQTPLFALWNLEQYSEREMDEWAGLISDELKLLQGVLKADKKRYDFETNQ